MYFARALNKVFKEGIGSKIKLKGWTAESFDLNVQVSLPQNLLPFRLGEPLPHKRYSLHYFQWCYNGQLVLPAIPDEENSKKIDRYLDFLVFADYLLITSKKQRIAPFFQEPR
jgi:hypothetical protein